MNDEVERIKKRWIEIVRSSSSLPLEEMAVESPSWRDLRCLILWIEKLEAENKEMRRTFGSDPLFKEAHSQGIVEGLEMAAKIVSKYKEEPYTRDTGVEAENMEGEIRAQIEKEKQGA